jgi:hypothetical protein
MGIRDGLVETAIEWIAQETVMSKGDRAASLKSPHHAPRLYAVERFVEIVWRGAMSPEDPRTLELLAAVVGTSRSRLKMLCNTLGIAPRDARDLARLFRASVLATGDRNDLHNHLQVVEQVTMAKLFERAGLEYPTMPSPLQFLELQRLVRNEHVVNALTRLVQEQLA